MSDHHHEGGCSCGQVRYRLTSDPMFVHCCHCTSCQRETGSEFAINALIETDRVEVLSGTTEAIAIPAESGSDQKIIRCPECKSALWSFYAGPDEEVAFVRAGTLDEPGRVPPDVHIFTRSKLPWLELPENAKCFDVYYEPASTWPEAALKRRALTSWSF